MDHPIIGYLYTIATISVTFAGFSALLAIFRQIIGGRLGRYDTFFIQSVLVRSLIIIVCALLPALLAMLEMSPHMVWRVSSLAAAILLGVFSLAWPMLRRRVSKTPMSSVSRTYFGVQGLTAIFLLMAAFDLYVAAGPGYFALGLTIFMIVTWVSVLLSLEILFAASSTKKNRR